MLLVMPLRQHDILYPSCTDQIAMSPIIAHKIKAMTFTFQNHDLNFPSNPNKLLKISVIPNTPVCSSDLEDRLCPYCLLQSRRLWDPLDQLSYGI